MGIAKACVRGSVLKHLGLVAHAPKPIPGSLGRRPESASGEGTGGRWEGAIVWFSWTLWGKGRGWGLEWVWTGLLLKDGYPLEIMAWPYISCNTCTWCWFRKVGELTATLQLQASEAYIETWEWDGEACLMSGWVEFQIALPLNDLFLSGHLPQILKPITLLFTAMLVLRAPDWVLIHWTLREAMKSCVCSWKIVITYSALPNFRTQDHGFFYCSDFRLFWSCGASLRKEKLKQVSNHSSSETTGARCQVTQEANINIGKVNRTQNQADRPGQLVYI
jgi:hypothetical protein